MNYTNLPDNTRVWIYQADQPFSEDHIHGLKQLVKDFTQQWVSHNRQLRAFGDVLHNQFVVLMVDESMAGASGCSIDKSVHFIKHIEQQTKRDLFNRMIFTYKEGDSIKSADRDTFETLYQSGKINDDTLVFDNLVNNKKDFDENWIKPLSQSWHKRMV